MNCISFSIFYDNEKRMRALKIQSKNLLNMKMVVNYLNFVFRIEVKTKSKYRILNFVFQFIKNTKWHFGYTDSGASCEFCDILKNIFFRRMPQVAASGICSDRDFLFSYCM